jgi:hypothetical protein
MEKLKVYFSLIVLTFFTIISFPLVTISAVVELINDHFTNKQTIAPEKNKLREKY